MRDVGSSFIFLGLRLEITEAIKETRVVKEIINHYYNNYYLFIDILNLYLHKI